MNISHRVGTAAGFGLSLAILLLFATSVSAKTGSKSQLSPASSAIGVTLDLSDFGGIGDGVADNGPAFQSALDALALSGGGTLLIPAGQYLVATPVVKDFAGLTDQAITIRGVPSSTMPAPTSSTGEQLAAGLDLTSRIIPATGNDAPAFTFTHLTHLLVEHIGFTGRENQLTDAYIVLHFNDIDEAIIRHCEFYGLSSFTASYMGPGNIVRATYSDLSIESSVFLGCTGNSGIYGAVVENLNWRRFNINNSIFLDYGLGSFFSKTGLGSPVSWIDIGNAAPASAKSPWREAVVRDTFLDEGGWVGITAYPYHWGASAPIDLVHISGIKVNVSNLNTSGNSFYDVENLFIENSYYGWSHNANAAIDLHRINNVILDELTCVAEADSIWADDSIGKLTVINSEYAELISDPQRTTVINVPTENDPVQYVRQQFISALSRPPDPAAHFYWSKILAGCGQDDSCLNQKRSQLSEYLSRSPQPSFSITGRVVDENGLPLSGVTATLTGQRPVSTPTDSEGAFQFSNLPTSGVYTIEVSKQHYHFGTNSQTFALPSTNVSVNFNGQLDHHSISGRITRANGSPMSGVNLKLAESPTSTVTTDANGNYSFSDLPAGLNYTVVPSLTQAIFSPESKSFDDLSMDQTANFAGQLTHVSIEGKVVDTLGNALSEADVSLTGSQSANAVTDSEGTFNFSSLPASGTYTVRVSKQHYSFEIDVKTFTSPDDDISFTFAGELNRHSIKGTIKRTNGTAISGVGVQLSEPSIRVVTDTNGTYSFPDLPAGETYTIIPSLDGFEFASPSLQVTDLSADVTSNFVGKLVPDLLTSEELDIAIALDSVSFLSEPFPIFNPNAFGTDKLTRVILFVRNSEEISDIAQVVVVATDKTGNAFPLQLEHVMAVPGQPSLKQFNVKLSPNLPKGNYIWINLSVGGVQSNSARIRLADGP